MEVSDLMLAIVALWRSASAAYASLNALPIPRLPAPDTRVFTLAVSWSNKLEEVPPAHVSRAASLPFVSPAGVGGGAAGTAGEAMVTTSAVLPSSAAGDPPNQAGLHTPRDSCVRDEQERGKKV
jgi:hypothetical protein